MPKSSAVPTLFDPFPVPSRAGLLLLALFFPLLVPARADSNRIPAAPAGIVETGVPSFVVLGPEALGLSTPPTDLELLHDGRVLAVAQHEIAFGDGLRWETFRAAPDQEAIYAQVAIGKDDGIYVGINGGFARVDLGVDGFWRSTRVSGLPADKNIQNSTMVSVQMLDDEWYWYGGSGAIVGWRPGEVPREMGNVSSIDQIFGLGKDVFISEQASGGLFRLMAPGAPVERVLAAERLASETVTCTVPYDATHLLVGTNSSGLKLFDGTTFTPFGPPGMLNRGARVNDLCAINSDFFAAAVDTVGIVFFDRTGKIVQGLERSLDHRLARVQRLQYSSDGVLWALLNEGIARVEFPSPVSQFEPLIGSGLAYARPLRHDGRLWFLADGHAMRGVYNPAGRLESVEEDAPPGRFVFNLMEIDGDLLASSENGLFLYRGSGWTMVVPNLVNARVVSTRRTDGNPIYIARGEFGVLEKTADGYAARRIPMAALADNYGAVEDAAGILWLELGTSRVGRLDPRPAVPTLQIFGTRDGLTDGWVEAYIFEGVARFHLPNHLFRFDEASHRFVRDEALIQRLPQLLIAGGRPVSDPDGRLWYTANGTANRVDLAPGGNHDPVAVHVGFAPSDFTIEESGMVWMFLHRHLVRLDTHLPVPAPAVVHAIITSVQFPASNRQLFAPGASLAPIGFSDNTVIVHFAAPANPFASPVSFDVMLEGASDQWVSTGNVGSATFNRLKEGNYVFRVRPVIAGHGSGQEARLSFTIRPPWFRTPLAWFIYVAGAIGLVLFAAWLSAFLQRRENARLELLVARRTEELNATNTQLNRQIEETTEKSVALSASEERYRSLNADLEQRVDARTAELSLSNQELQQRESLFRLIFEHAPVGISWKRADLDGVYHFNSTYRRILQLPADTLTDNTLLSALVHPDDAAEQRRVNELVGTGKIDNYNLEERFVLVDGRQVWGSLSVAVIRDASGRIIQDIGILEDITARKQAEDQLSTTYKNLVDASRMAGMAEVATGVLHNVGNVLNSLNVSSNLMLSNLRQSKADSLAKLSSLVNERAATLADFLTQDPKGKLVPELLSRLAQTSVQERDWLLQEVTSMQKNIDHIKDIVSMQQSYATVIGVSETLDAALLFEDALRMNTAALMRHDVHLVREFLPVPQICVEKGKVLQILINVIRNAKYACDDGQQQFGLVEKIITVRIEPAPEDRVRLIVRDNGIGIAPENLTRIFGHGFTTRAYGHGFGLHSSALAAREMKGSLTASSEGLGKGATFTLEIPVAPFPSDSGPVNVIPVTADKVRVSS